MGKEPTVLIGLGSTKSGTTWLYHYLADHPQCHVRSRKELHYFDNLDPTALNKERQKVSRKAEELGERAETAKGPMRYRVRKRFDDALDWLLVLNEDDDADRDHAYISFLKSGRAGKPVVADITPSYGIQSQEIYQRMMKVSEDVRFLYLMRDPVARLWSHVRMNAEKSKKSAPFETRCADLLQSAIDGNLPEMRARGDYATVLERAPSLPEGKFLALFYEDIFDGDGLRKLCEFAGLNYMPTDLTVRHHEGKSLDMTPEQENAAFQALFPQYEAAQAYMGTLPRKWQDRINSFKG
ncbi:sulfotransferase [Donghicola sp. XS_ASV15]|uniref:sulfotransferase n=1 Tax=Donghicola sp. XS_ASV15 TaxID=3241295 RepID=UPI003518C599